MSERTKNLIAEWLIILGYIVFFSLANVVRQWPQ